MNRHASLIFAFLIAGAMPVFAQTAEAPSSSPATASPEVRLFQQLEDKWSIAQVNRDQYGMELLLSPVYIGVSAKGDVSTKNQQIATLFSRGPSQLVSMEQKVVNVRTFGDMAVVQGTYILKNHENGNTTEDRGIFTHVFERVRTNWLCVNAQRTLVVEQPDEKQRVAKKTDSKGDQKTGEKSSALLPFHIPLLHKSSDSTAKNDTTPQPPQ